jgi:hypothetical protein
MKMAIFTEVSHDETFRICRICGMSFKLENFGEFETEIENNSADESRDEGVCLSMKTAQRKKKLPPLPPFQPPRD